MRDSNVNLRILIVEDDPRMLELLCCGLRDCGYTAMPASDGGTGCTLALGFDFDVIVLDVGLPNRDGYEIARTLRKHGKVVPILMLTARDAEDDIIRGLESGADDYLLKPFSFPELVARIHTLSRAAVRSTKSSTLAINASRLAATRDNTHIPLSRTEFTLLSVLHEHLGHTVARDRLIRLIWGEQQRTKENSLDVLVNSLRGKVDGPFQHKLIQTIRGLGYRLRSRTDAASRGQPRQLADGEQTAVESVR